MCLLSVHVEDKKLGSLFRESSEFALNKIINLLIEVKQEAYSRTFLNCLKIVMRFLVLFGITFPL